MKFDILRYNKMLEDNHIYIIYSGPMWAEKLEGLAEMLQSRLNLDDLSLNAAQSVFSVFIEQMNNMIMYSAEKECFDRVDDKRLEISKGIFIFGKHKNTYFIQSGNVMKSGSVEMLKSRIDYLNTLDKKELQQYYKQQMRMEDDNPESKGAGLGLIEIAKRATSKIDYDFIPRSNDLSYFTMYVTI